MPDLLISALVQAPFVAVMAYLVNQFLKHLDARDEEWRASMNEADEHLAERSSAATTSPPLSAPTGGETKRPADVHLHRRVSIYSGASLS